MVPRRGTQHIADIRSGHGNCNPSTAKSNRVLQFGLAVRIPIPLGQPQRGRLALAGRGAAEEDRLSQKSGGKRMQGQAQIDQILALVNSKLDETVYKLPLIKNVESTRKVSVSGGAAESKKDK